MFSSIQKRTIPLFLAGILFAGLLPVSSLHAQTIDVAGLIDLLEKQIAALQEKIAELENVSGGDATLETFGDIGFFQSYLERGIMSDEVKDLQEFLGTLPGIYPEHIISGYFGPLTESAVKRFQATYDIETLGVVGPKTRAKLNELLRQGQQKVPPVTTPSLGGSEPIDTTPAPEEQPQATMPPSKPVELPTPASFHLEPKPSYDEAVLAQKIHDLVNNERAKAGLAPLVWDWQIAQVAFLHSADQARDNQELTDPDILCNYPLIRHEGFLFGYSLKERFDNKNLAFRRGGENIGILSAVKDLVYQFPQDNPPAECPDIPTFPVGDGTQEERTALYQSIFQQSLEAVRGADRGIVWVNRSWHSADEVAVRIVEGWMNSPGHKANILTPYFDSDGIGVVAVNDFFVITHDFVDK